MDIDNITVTIAKSEILEALEKNKLAHIEDFDKATEVYYEDLKKELSKRQKDCKERKDVNLYIQLTKPVNQVKMYDKYIQMFKAAKETELQLNTEQYACIVQDEWDWIQSAKISNSFYSSRA